MELLGLLVIWVGLCIWVAKSAEAKGRNGVGFFLLAFFTSPVFGGICVALCRDLAAEQRQELERRRYEDNQTAERKREHEKQLAALSALKTPSAAAPHTVSVADEIAKLGELRDKGLLTSDEFQAQKAALLKGA